MDQPTSFSDFDYTTIEEIPEQRLRRGLLEKRLRLLAKGPTARILEVGIGNGDITLMLKKHFESVTCVDADAFHCEQVSRRLRERHLSPANMITIPIEQADLPPKHFDHVVLLNLLEHLKHPVQVLDDLSTTLTTSGVVHITVPLADSLHRRLGVSMGMLPHTEALAESDIHFGHFRVYTPDLLAAHIGAAGLAVSFEESFYLKPLPTSVLTPLAMEVHQGLYELGRSLPQFASYLYMEAKVVT